MTFQMGSGLELVVYADAAYAPEETKKESVSGGAVMWGRAAIQWISRTHKRTTLSSSEADYVAMAEGFKEALFLRSVWRFFLPEFGDPCIQVYEDTNRFSWRSTLSRTRTRSTSTCVTTSCDMSRAESLKSCTHKVLARRFLDETPCQGRLPFSQELH